jgi:prophage antirepressor-like protein
MQYQLQIFEYQDANEFRVVDIDGEPWFVLVDVCRQLDLKSKNGSVSHHADRLDDDERRTVPASVLREAASLSDRCLTGREPARSPALCSLSTSPVSIR